MFYSTNWQFLCNYLLKYKLTPAILWKLLLEFGKFHRILPEPKNILHKYHFLMKAFLSTKVWGISEESEKC